LDERPYGDRSDVKVILSLERGIDPYDWDFRLAPQWTLSKCCRWEPVDRPIMSEIVRELHITGSPEGQDRHGLPPGSRYLNRFCFVLFFSSGVGIPLVF